MTKYNTGNPVGSADPRDRHDNSQAFDQGMNSENPSFNDRLGRARKSWAGMESEFSADQAHRESEFQGDQAHRESEFDSSQYDRANRFNSFIAASGYIGTGTNGEAENYAAGIDITEYNQVVRDTTGEFWRLSGSTELPYTTTGAGLPEGGSFTPVGDAVLRQELLQPQGAALVAGGSIIYRPSVQQLFAADATHLAAGQAAKVRGTEFSWNGSAWEPVGRIFVNSWGARGDSPIRLNDTSGSNSRQAFIDAATYAQQHGHKYVFAEPGIYYTPDLLASEMHDLYVVGDGVFFTCTDIWSDQRGHAQILALSELEYQHGLAWNSKSSSETRGVIAFEFDDATWTQFAVLPHIFKKYGVVYGVAWHTAGGQDGWIREMHRHGFEIMAHSPDNTSAPTLTKAELEQRAQADLTAISAITGRDDNVHFVYPMHSRNDLTDNVLSQFYVSGRGLESSHVMPRSSAGSWLCSAIGLDARTTDQIKQAIKDAWQNDSLLVIYGHGYPFGAQADRIEEIVNYAAGLGVKITSPCNVKTPPVRHFSRYFKDTSEWALGSGAVWDATTSAPEGVRSIRAESTGTGFSGFSFNTSAFFQCRSQKAYSHYRLSFLYKSVDPITASSLWGLGVRATYRRLISSGQNTSGASVNHLCIPTLPAADFDNKVTLDVYVPNRIAELRIGLAGTNIAEPFDIYFDDFRCEKIGEVNQPAVNAYVDERISSAVFIGGAAENRISVGGATDPLEGPVYLQNYSSQAYLVPRSSSANDAGKEVVVVANQNEFSGYAEY
ncbi:polysaccharide deacetylase family protein [Marinobacter shengliensis]|uniref:polysaccharide deacetylase family protein n=1 Tax=Marinobacter shengliensis TaxID=1389223 RepID=UPI001107ABBE|nr:polysaccharide deacetylase family protein [Marinobacter shengliensis]